MEASKLSELRFLLGGFGDARHLYASLIDLNQQFEKLDVEKQKNVKAYFLLNDINACAVAKLIIMFACLRKLNDIDYNKIERDLETTKAAALVFYVFISNVMPEYIESEVLAIIKKLISSELKSDEYWSFIKLDDAGWIKVKKVLEQWTTKCPVKIEEMIDIWKQPDYMDIPFIRAAAEEFRKNLISQIKV